MFDDVRLAWRAVRRRPLRILGRAATAGVGLTVGVSAFILADAVFFKPLPVRDSDTLYVVGRPSPLRADQLGALSAAELEELARLPGVLGVVGIRVASFEPRFAEAEDLGGVEVTANFFDVLGVQPVLGRPFTGLLEAAEEPRPIVIADELWRSRFGADVALVGRTVALGGRAVQVAGVMPRGFDVPGGANVWMPLVRTRRPFAVRDSMGIVRLGATGAPTAAAVSSGRLVMRPLREYVRPGESSAVALVGLVTLLVVLLVWIHVFALRLRMVVDRSTEFAVRAALGATRARLARQWLFEVALDTALATGLALVGIPAALAAGRWWLPPDPTLGQRVAFDARAGVCLLGLAIASVAVGAAAHACVRIGPNSARGCVARTGASARGRVRAVVLAAHAALVAAVVYVAVLAVESYLAAASLDLGPDPSGLFAIEVPGTPTTSALTLQTEEIVARLERLPGVLAVAGGPEALAPGGLLMPVTAQAPRSAVELAAAERNAFERRVSAGYLRVAGIGVVEGRDFDVRVDRPGEVVVLSRTLARSLDPSGAIVGRRVYVGSDLARTVVGVAEDVRAAGPGRPPVSVVYTFGPPSGAVLVRLGPDRARTLAQVRKVVAGVTRARGPIRVRSEEETSRRLTTPHRSRAGILGALAGVTVLLGLLGLASAAVEAVRERQREVAVRLAVGAPARRVALTLVALVVSVGGMGAGAGLALGVAMARAAASLFFEVRPFDGSAVLLVVVGLMGGVAVAAAASARAVVSADVATILRAE
jgi:putative ABC transport system permease protein